MKFQSIVASVLTIACSFCVLTSRAATTEPRTENVSRTLTQNEEYDLKKGELTIADGVTIDLAGHSLTYKNVSSFSGTGTITDTSTGEPGKLHISPSKAGTFSAGLTGNLRLVMEGTSSLTLNTSHTYYGGTQIDGGKLVCGVSAYTLANVTPFGTKPSTIDVNQGGTLDCNGKYGWAGYSINLNGGAITSGGQRNSTTQIFNAPITLTENSSFTLPSSKIYSLAGEIDLGNKTLSVSLSSLLHYMPASIKDGFLDVTGTAAFQVEKDIDMSTVNVKISAPLNLQAFTLDIRDFETEVIPSGEGKIIVHGALKPVDEVVPVCTLASGATIDLSGVTTLADLSEVALADGVTAIEVALGDTKPELGTPLANFGRALTGVTFSFKNDETPAIVTAAGVLTYGTSTAPVATWTGNAGDGDVANAENWEEGRKPSAEIEAVFSDEIGKLSIPARTELDWTKVTFDNVTLTEDCDLSGLNPEIINPLSVINVGEFTLTIAGKDGAYECAAEITTESENGKLCIVVPENATYTNNAFKMTGKLNLVKKGPGTMVAVDDKDFGGELIVKAGKLECGVANLSGVMPFGTGCTIKLEEGGVLDPMGAINWSAQTIKMNGGKIVNSVKATGIATTAGKMVDYNPNGQTNSTMIPFNPTLVLLTTATIETTEDFNFQGTVNESDYTLNLVVPKGHYFAWFSTSVPNLKLNVTGGGALATYSKKPVLLSAQNDIKLTLSDAVLNLPVHATYGSGTMDVTDYTSACTNKQTNAIGALNVYGTFTPAAVDEEGKEYFYGATMQSGSAIDLSQKSTTWGVQSASFGNNTIKFAEGIGDLPTSVTIKLGTRKFELGEKVIDWTSKPINVVFTFTRNGDPVDVEARALADGLYYGQEIITRAEWTGEAGNGDLSDSKNWKDGILPTGEIQAKFTGDISKIVAPAKDTFACSEFYFENAELTQTADFSWIDLNKITDDSVIDINGQTLKIASTNSISTTSATITDSVGGGVVEFTIGEGVVHTNASLALEGGLKFVKKGGGIYVAAKYPQLYTNVTEVVEGGIRCAEGQWMNKEDGKSPFGAACTIALGAGTFLDPAGSYAWANHTIEMNGGIISNTVAQSGMSNTDYNAGKDSFAKPFNPTLDLSVNSLFVSTANFNFKGTVKGNGHVLTVDINESYYGTRWLSHDSTEAMVVFKTNTLVRILKNFPMYEPDLTLVMDGAKFDVGGNWAVSNYIAKSKSAISAYRGTTDGGWSLAVYGTFRPETSDFLGCVMQNGSTLDLTAQEGAFNLYNSQGQKNLKNGATPWLCQHVTFADNATITIDVYERDFAGKKNKQIVSWTTETKPANLDTLTFVLDAQSKAEGYRLMPTADGISVERSGMLLMLK